MKIGITGASGFIGKRLVKKLEEDGFEVFKFVRRDVQNENEIFWRPSKQEIDIEKFEFCSAIFFVKVVLPTPEGDDKINITP